MYICLNEWSLKFIPAKLYEYDCEANNNKKTSALNMTPNNSGITICVMNV